MLSKNVNLLDAEANRLYIDAMKEAAPESYVPRMATVRMTSKRTETNPILGDAPAMSEMQQHEPYTFTPLIDDVVTTTMAKYGAGVQVSEDDWNDDQLGAFAERVQEMGREAILLPNALLIAALINGDTQAGWDGVSFFNATHPNKGQQTATWSNIVTGAGTSAANVRTDIGKVIARFGTFRLLNNRPANTRLTSITIVAPWNMRDAILEATNPNQMLVNSAPLAGLGFSYVFDPDLDDDDNNDIYFLNTSHPIRPLVLWEREAARLIPEAANTGAHFVNDVRRYKSKWRGKVAYGMPQRAIKVTNT